MRRELVIVTLHVGLDQALGLAANLTSRVFKGTVGALVAVTVPLVISHGSFQRWENFPVCTAMRPQGLSMLQSPRSLLPSLRQEFVDERYFRIDIPDVIRGSSGFECFPDDFSKFKQHVRLCGGKVEVYCVSPTKTAQKQ